jgi:predicted transcriptional regulator
MSSSTTTSLKLDAETKARVQRLADLRRRSAHWLMREALAQFLDREEAREQLRQDALTAWGAWKADGLHASADEADAWLAQLEAGDEMAPPECHS